MCLKWPHKNWILRSGVVGCSSDASGSGTPLGEAQLWIDTFKRHTLPSELACPYHLMPERSHSYLDFSSLGRPKLRDSILEVHAPAEHQWRHEGLRPLSELPKGCPWAPGFSCPPAWGLTMSEPTGRPPRTSCTSQVHNLVGGPFLLLEVSLELKKPRQCEERILKPPVVGNWVCSQTWPQACFPPAHLRAIEWL